MTKPILFIVALLLSFSYLAQSNPTINQQLHDAIMANNLAKVKVLINSGADVNSTKNESHQTPLYLAMKKNSLPIVKYLVEKGSATESNIYWAVSNENIPMVEYLLGHGFKPGKTTVDAAEKNNLKMLKILVEAGAPVDYTEKRRRSLFKKFYVSPIGFAFDHKNEAMIRYFADNGVPINTIINEAFSHGEYELIKEFTPRVKDKGNLLIQAFNFENKDLVEFIIKAGADINSVDINGNSMLLIGAKNGNLNQVVMCLEKYDMYIHKKNEKGETALMLAASKGSLSVCEYLVQHGQVIDAQSNLGETALFFCLNNREKEVFDFLLTNGANINQLNLDGDNLLITAAKKDNLSTVKYLHNKGMDIHATNKQGHSAYYYVVSASSIFKEKHSFQDYFIGFGVDINTRGNHGQTAMFIAIDDEDMPRILYLKEKGATLDTKNLDGERPSCDDKDIVIFLVENGVDINAFNGRHDTYLCDAVADNDLELAHYLIDHGADPNLKCYFDEQPIIKAVEDNNLTLVKFLAENGADVNAIGYFNRNVMEYAVKEDKPEMISYLKSKGAMTKEEKNDQFRIAMELESKIKSALIAEDLTTVNRLLAQNEVVILQRKLVENLAFVAAKQGNTQLINKLLSDDVDFTLEDPVNKIGQTILFVATIYNQEILIKDLLARGANYTNPDFQGKTPVEYAEKKSIKKIFKNWKK